MKIKLEKETVDLFKQHGHAIPCNTTGKMYFHFPHFISDTEEEGIYELDVLGTLPDEVKSKFKERMNYFSDVEIVSVEPTRESRTIELNSDQRQILLKFLVGRAEHKLDFYHKYSFWVKRTNNKDEYEIMSELPKHLREYSVLVEWVGLTDMLQDVMAWIDQWHKAKYTKEQPLDFYAFLDTMASKYNVTINRDYKP